MPKDGAEVPDNTFWHRRLKDGDVSLVPEKGVKNAVKKEGVTK
ncbi:DUF2635 domain-containing protein [Klebsiella pneumoniae]